MIYVIIPIIVYINILMDKFQWEINLLEKIKITLLYIDRRYIYIFRAG